MQMLLLLAAEAASFDPSSVIPALSTFGSLGFAVWYAWYVTTKTMPDLQREQREQIKQLNEAHNEMTKKLAADFREDVEKLAQQYERWFRVAANKRDEKGGELA